MGLAVYLNKTLEELGNLSTFEIELWSAYLEDQNNKSKRGRRGN